MPKKNSRKTLKLIIGGAVVIAAGVVLYTSFFVQTDVEPTPDEQREELPTLNMQALEDGRIDTFHSWQSIPVEVGETGRSNPFSR